MKESARVQQKLTLKGNRITTKAVVDSMEIYLTYKERNKEEQKIKTIETVIEKEVNILHWWQKALIWIGIVALAFLFTLLIIILILRKST